MITVSSKRIKISFTGFVLVLLLGSVYQVHSSAFAEAAFRAAFPPKRNFMQQVAHDALLKVGVREEPKTLCQLTFTKTNILVFTLLAGYGVCNIAQKAVNLSYLTIAGKYQRIKDFYNSAPEKFDSITDEANFYHSFITEIRIFFNKKGDDTTMVDIDAFIKNLNKDISSLDSKSKFTPPSLSAALSGKTSLSGKMAALKTNLKQISDYMTLRRETLKNLAELYSKCLAMKTGAHRDCFVLQYMIQKQQQPTIQHQQEPVHPGPNISAAQPELSSLPPVPRIQRQSEPQPEASEPESWTALAKKWVQRKALELFAPQFLQPTPSTTPAPAANPAEEVN